VDAACAHGSAAGGRRWAEEYGATVRDRDIREQTQVGQAVEDDLLEARQVFGGDDVVQGCVWYEVPDFSSTATASDSTCKFLAGSDHSVDEEGRRNEAKVPRIDEGFMRTRSSNRRPSSTTATRTSPYRHVGGACSTSPAGSTPLPPGRWRRAPSPGSSSSSPTVLASALPPAAHSPADRSAGAPTHQPPTKRFRNTLVGAASEVRADRRQRYRRP
jgi:hypothetical protein